MQQISAQADFDTQINDLFDRSEYSVEFDKKKIEIEDQIDRLIHIENAKNPGEDLHTMDKDIDQITEKLMAFYDNGIMNNVHSDVLGHSIDGKKNNQSAASIGQDNQSNAKNNKEKNQLDNEKEKVFKSYLNNDFFNVAEDAKQLFEIDPRELSIKSIMHLDPTSQLFPGEQFSNSKLRSFQRKRKQLEQQLKELAETLKGQEDAADDEEEQELKTSLKYIDDFPKD